MHEQVRQLVADGVTAGELTDVQIGPLARALLAALHGSVVGWAISGRGTLRDWLRQDIETVLRPHMRRSARRPKRSSRRHQITRS
jgi:hypothetical protein